MPATIGPAPLALAPPTPSPAPPWLAGAAEVAGASVPQPLSVGELFDRGFHVLRAEIGVLGPVVGAAILPVAILLAFADRQALGSDGTGEVLGGGLSALGGHGAWVIAGVAIGLLWPALVAGPACRVAAASWYGRRIDRRTAARGLLRMPSLIAAVIVVDLASVLGLVAGGVPAVLIWLGLHLTLPLMVLEGRNPFRALARSLQLTLRRAGWAFLTVLGVVVLGFVVSFALSLLPGLVAGNLGEVPGFVVSAVVFVIVHVVTWSWALIVLTLFSLDVRARSEGLDLLVRAGIAGA